MKQIKLMRNKWMVILSAFLFMSTYTFAQNTIQRLYPYNNQYYIDSAIAFNWSYTDSISKYKFQISNDSLFSTIYLEDSTTSLLSAKKAHTFNKKYYWRISGYKQNNWLNWSSPVVYYTFNPQKYDSLLVWLKADAGVNLSAGVVAKWTNLKDTNYNFLPTTGTEPLKINKGMFAQPSVSFRGGKKIENASLANNILFPNQKSSYIIMLGLDLNSDVYGYICTNIFGNGYGRYFGDGDAYIQNYRTNRIGQYPGSMPNNGLHIYTYKNSAPVCEFYVNGNSKGTRTGEWNVGNNFILGRDEYGNNLPGEVAELFLFNTYISDSLRKQVENYLKDKYAPKLVLAKKIVLADLCKPIKVNGNFKSYLWSNGDTTETANIKTSGKYWIRTIDAFDRTQIDTVTVLLPTYNKPTNTLVCNFLATNWNLPYNKSDYTFLWNNGIIDSTININTPGKYFCTITKNGGCTFNTDTFTIALDSFAFKASLGPDTSLCVGNKLYLKKEANNAVIYLWSNGLSTPEISISTSGTYSLTATNAIGCIAKDTIIVSVLGNAPSSNFTFTNNCKGKNIAFTNTSSAFSGTNIIGQQWNIYALGFSSTLQNPTLTVNDTLSYTVIQRVDANNGCSDLLQKTIKIYPNTTINITNLNSCTDVNTKFIANINTSGNSINNISWKFADTSFTNNANTINKIFKTSGNNFIKIVTTTNNGCVDSLNKTLFVNKSPLVDFSVSSPCKGTMTQFSDLSNLYGPFSLLSRKWILSPTDSASLLGSYGFIYPDTGLYIVKLKLIVSNGCIGEKDSLIRITQAPNVNFTFTKNCKNSILEMYNTSTPFVNIDKITKWTWSVNNDIIGNTDNVNYNTNSADSLKIMLQIKDTNNCSNFVLKEIPLLNKPIAAITDENKDYDLPGIFNIGNSSNFASSFEWFENQMFKSTNINYLLNISNDTDVTIKLIAKNDVGCVDSTFKTLEFTKKINDVLVNKINYAIKNNYIRPTVNFSNIGTRTLTKLQFENTIDGFPNINEEWLGSLAPKQTAEHTFKTSIYINNTNKKTLCINANSPNDVEDKNMKDNYACISLNKELDFFVSSILYDDNFNNLKLKIASEIETYITIIINNTNGTIVKKIDALNIKQGINLLDISDLNITKGLYIMQIRGENIDEKIKLLIN